MGQTRSLPIEYVIGRQFVSADRMIYLQWFKCSIGAVQWCVCIL